ncbi:hypothetical protein CPC08DRAFT_754849 [Agrocybe pediades]|nr:hypothetical protein CPC08DRAFT_754849 [Agrocybe pediades]
MYQSQPGIYYNFPLPSLSASETGWHAFTFTYNPDIANCIVTGPNCEVNGPYTNVRVAEVRTQFGETRLRSGSGQTFATIQWSNAPVVEITGITQRQYAGQFLRLEVEPNQTTNRRMKVGGKSYRWEESGSAGIYLYRAVDRDMDPLARIRMVDPRRLILELQGEAFPAGLFQPCIVATVLLYGGRNLG